MKMGSWKDLSLWVNENSKRFYRQTPLQTTRFGQISSIFEEWIQYPMGSSRIFPDRLILP
jgi:hypothetical protein